MLRNATPSRTALARQLGTTDMSLLRRLNRQSLGVGAIPDIELQIEAAKRLLEMDLRRWNKDSQSPSRMVVVEGRDSDTQEVTLCFVPAILMEYSSILPLLALVGQDAAALVLLWEYRPALRERHIRIWCEMAKYEKWPRQEIRELLSVLTEGNEFESTDAPTLQLLYEASDFQQPAPFGLRKVRRNTLWLLILETLEDLGKRKTEAMSFLEAYLPGVGEDTIKKGLKMAREILDEHHLQKKKSKTD